MQFISDFFLSYRKQINVLNYLILRPAMYNQINADKVQGISPFLCKINLLAYMPLSFERLSVCEKAIFIVSEFKKVSKPLRTRRHFHKTSYEQLCTKKQI